MLPRSAALLTLALLGEWCLPASAQQFAPPSAGDAVLPSPRIAPLPAAELLPATPVFAADPEPEPPVDKRPFQPPPGWFAGVEVFVPWVHLSNVDPSQDGYEPVPNLGPTVSPQGTLGYRFERGNALLVSYRFLGSSGSASDSWGDWHERFDSQWLDLDYRGCLHGPWHNFTFQWQAGTRVASVNHDVRNSFPGWWAEDRLHFVGAGIHLGIDVNWYVPGTRLGLFGRADVGGLLGRSTERFQSLYQDVSGPIPDLERYAHTQAQFNGQAELGVSWTPPTQRWLRFETGWQLFDFLWDGENIANFGPFVRCEIGF